MIEIILAIILALTSIGSAIVVYVIRRLNQSDAERRHELETTRLQRDRLLKRVTELEKDTERLEEVEAQLRIVYTMVEELQEWKKEAEVLLQEKDITIEA